MYKVDFVVADIWHKKLLVPQYVMDHVHVLSSPEASLLNKYLSKYPGFQIETLSCDPIMIRAY